ncbi:MAG: AMP-binding protein [Verrucomicrobia bacterium]|nr:AMP-binding protein [Verrucomicrobiota bacterium]
MTTASNANIARHLGLMAAAQPAMAALKIPRGRTGDGRIDYLSLTFAELDAEVAGWQARLAAAGVRRGDRALVMVKPGLPLIAVVFALFRSGAIPVVIDPGMGLRNFLSCVAQSRPRVLVGIQLARFLSRVFRRSFASVAVRVAVDASPTARVAPASPDASAAALAENSATDLAAILFTSGSTGAPKGVCYEHGMFEAQVRMIRDAYDIEPGEVDLPMLPIFALFNPALGMTTVVPEMDPRRPAAVDPARIVQAIRQENVTNSFGSPTLWLKVSEYCERERLTLPSLRRVLSAGAPVPAALWENSRRLLPGGRLHSPYGATEALPVATVSSTEIDPATVRGACVGRPLPGINVRIIALTDDPIPSIAEARELPTGEVGEIIVQGPVVTRQYDAMPSATALAKIPAPDGSVWHRMGDCGFLDYSSRLWFAGRKAERVVTAEGPMFTEPCEQVFRQHRQVKRCALVGLGPRGRQQPALVVETPSAPSLRTARAFAAELRALALRHPHTARVTRFYFRPRFPVDVRHNAKIHRLKLAAWAARAPGIEVPAAP